MCTFKNESEDVAKYGIIFDLIEVVLVRAPAQVNAVLTEIDQICGIAHNDDEFIRIVKDKFDYDAGQISQTLEDIISLYIPNEEILNVARNIKRCHKTALMNNGISFTFKKWVEKYRLQNFFNVLYNSAIDGFRKPDVNAYKKISEMLKISLCRCILIDDKIENVIAASNAGMQAIYYNHKADVSNKLSEIIRRGQP
ncbi:MAG: HAD-IA family hydrolase [bacterium]|nr:MAG: HAD-IA family hydrolase [bacterium]